VNSNFNAPTTFASIPIGGRFVEVLSLCNEVATRIEPTTHRGKPVNARRSGGGLVFMAEWEPVLIHQGPKKYKCPKCGGVWDEFDLILSEGDCLTDPADCGWEDELELLGGLVFMADWEPVLVRPHRIQRQRTRGWRMPPNTVYVGRPSGWGNPFTLIENSISHTREGIVQLYSEVLERNETDRAKWVNSHIHELRGKNLACWCRLDQPCHADVLLRLANK
jgi:hypothetical protein